MTSDAPPWEDPRRALARHGLEPKRSFSQNFLTSKDVFDRIAAAAVLEDDEPVVELGPGVGTLTAALLRRGGRVHAIERDRDMLAVLRADLAGQGRFVVEEGDAATVDLAALADAAGGRIAVAGNLPYAITGAILKHLVEERTRVRRAVVMVQREVRDRLLAEPGTKDYGALTVFVTAAFRVEPVLTVKPGAFHPPPKVASAVVRLVPLEPARAEETESFRTVVRASFEQRRKTLRNALTTALSSPELVARTLARAGIDGMRRGETLSVEEFATLGKALDVERASALP